MTEFKVMIRDTPEAKVIKVLGTVEARDNKVARRRAEQTWSRRVNVENLIIVSPRQYKIWSEHYNMIETRI